MLYLPLFLKLSSKAQINNIVRTIALADDNDGSPPKSCIVSGWGMNDIIPNYLSTKLMEVNVTLVNDKRCIKEDSYCSKGKNGPGKVRTFIYHNMYKQTLVNCHLFIVVKQSLQTVYVLPGRLWWSIGL